MTGSALPCPASPGLRQPPETQPFMRKITRVSGRLTGRVSRQSNRQSEGLSAGGQAATYRHGPAAQALDTARR